MPTTKPVSARVRRHFLSSELSRNARSVMDAAESEPVEIDRRDGNPLVLMSQHEADAKDVLLSLAAQLIAVAIDDDDGPIGQRLAERFDWMLALSVEMRETCASAIIRAARASFSTGQAHLVVVELTAWKATAEAIAAGLDRDELEWVTDPQAVERP
ncbi:prevent-host-death protein [Curtobacterium sp. PhB136]|uniref:prevent-host-death protein n=1 Tax=Curtobacterium sp. PhB136 TaxID=2485181 RepID=UPI00104B5A37|nr:prevent-host-death protein [Curtobacterium sp. PhB136]TCK64418.1 hypothetical protein EDF27_1669 [Curtobacterium sp. PhB136]